MHTTVSVQVESLSIKKQKNIQFILLRKSGLKCTVCVFLTIFGKLIQEEL